MLPARGMSTCNDHFGGDWERKRGSNCTPGSFSILVRCQMDETPRWLYHHGGKLGPVANTRLFAVSR